MMNIHKKIGLVVAALLVLGCDGNSALPMQARRVDEPISISAVSGILIPDRATTANSPSVAGMADLTIQYFGLTQAVMDEPLVVGKPTAAIIKIASSSNSPVSAVVKVIVDGKPYEQVATITGPQTMVTLRIDAPSAVKPVSAQVSALPTGDVTDPNPADNTQTAVFQTVQTPERVVMFFLPVDWSPQDRSTYNYNSTFKQFIQDGGDFFTATYPLPPSQVVVDYTMTPHMLTTFEKAIVNSQGKESRRNELVLYAGISVAGRRYRPDASIVVGVLPPKWFDNHGEPGVLGFALPGVSGIASAQYDPELEPIVAAHEIGHLYGLGEDYDFAVKPARPCNPVLTPGYWVQQEHDVTRASGKDLCTFMSAAGRNFLHWADQRIYEYLMAKFTLNRGKVSAPMVLAATMAWQLEADGYPSEMRANNHRFEPTQDVYCSVAGAALKAGSTLEVKLFSGNKLLRSVGKQATVAGDKWYPFQVAQGKELAGGNYRLDIFLDGQLAKSTDFEVKASQ